MKHTTIDLAAIIEVLNHKPKGNLNQDFEITDERCEEMLPQIDSNRLSDATAFPELIRYALEEALLVGETETEVFYLFYHVIHTHYKVESMANDPLAALLAGMGRR